MSFWKSQIKEDDNRFVRKVDPSYRLVFDGEEIPTDEIYTVEI